MDPTVVTAPPPFVSTAAKAPEYLIISAEDVMAVEPDVLVAVPTTCNAGLGGCCRSV